MRLIALLLAVVVAVCAWKLSRPHPKPVDVAAVIASVTHPSDALLGASAPVHAGAAFDPDEEPDEASLRPIEFETYGAIERNGGMPLVLTATGQRITIHPRLSDVHKVSCHKLANMQAWECSLSIVSALQPGDKPGTSGERVDVKRDAKGAWIHA